MDTARRGLIMVSGGTDAVALAGGVFDRANRGEEPTLRAIGAGAVNQMVKACAIATKMARERDKQMCLEAGFETVLIPSKDGGGDVSRSAVTLKVSLL